MVITILKLVILLTLVLILTTGGVGAELQPVPVLLPLRHARRLRLRPPYAGPGFIFWVGGSIMREYRRLRVPLLNPRGPSSAKNNLTAKLLYLG